MDHDSNISDSGENPRSSTVISVAQRALSYAPLIDELIVRIYSFLRFEGDASGAALDASCGNLTEIGPILVLESDAWWSDHRLNELSFKQKRGLISEVLSRAPMDGALLCLAIFTRERFRLLEREDIEVIHSWCVQLGSEQRRVALALAGIIMARWFAERPESELEGYLAEQCASGSAAALNTVLAMCLGLLQTATPTQARLIMNALLGEHVKRQLPELEPLGGVLGRLWGFLPADVEAWLRENAHGLSRKVFRLSVERIPSHTRASLTQHWKAQRAVRKHDSDD